MKTIVYYTCNTHDRRMDEICRRQLKKAGVPIVCVSLNERLPFGDVNLVMYGNRSPAMMHAQILRGLLEVGEGTVFLCESDVLYHPSHFDYSVSDNKFVYNVNVWRLRLSDGLAVWTDDLQQVSGICAPVPLLQDFYSRRVEQIAAEGFNRHYEPGVKQSIRVGDGVVNRMSEYPNVCIRHDANLTRSKWSPDEFRNPRYAKGWRTATELPYWGATDGLLERV